MSGIMDGLRGYARQISKAIATWYVTVRRKGLVSDYPLGIASIYAAADDTTTTTEHNTAISIWMLKIIW
nr:hypothetical protein CFP56_07448 [Quercus suber]